MVPQSSSRKRRQSTCPPPAAQSAAVAPCRSTCAAAPPLRIRIRRFVTARKLRAGSSGWERGETRGAWMQELSACGHSTPRPDTSPREGRVQAQRVRCVRLLPCAAPLLPLPLWRPPLPHAAAHLTPPLPAGGDQAPQARHVAVTRRPQPLVQAVRVPRRRLARPRLPRQDGPQLAAGVGRRCSRTVLRCSPPPPPPATGAQWEFGVGSGQERSRLVPGRTRRWYTTKRKGGVGEQSARIRAAAHALSFT